MTMSKKSGSCLCKQTDYEIVKMEPQGEIHAVELWDDSLQSVCQYPTEQCGWKSEVQRVNSQEVSWSNTFEVGVQMSFNAVPIPILEEIGFEVKNSYTNGESTHTSTSHTYSSACICDSDKCKGPWTNLTYRLQLVSSSLKVKLTVKRCGTTEVIDGEVKTHQFRGNSRCSITDGLCSASGGRICRPQPTPAPALAPTPASAPASATTTTSAATSGRSVEPGRTGNIADCESWVFFCSDGGRGKVEKARNGARDVYRCGAESTVVECKEGSWKTVARPAYEVSGSVRTFCAYAPWIAGMALAL